MAVKLRPVRLTDVPLQVRLKGAREACRDESDQAMRVLILARAFAPSDTTYWIAA